MAKPKGLPKSGGRKPGTPNKITADVKALAGVHGEAAIKTLVEIMRGGPLTPPAARVAAAKEILDRAFGKPMQRVEASGPEGVPLTVASLDLTPRQYEAAARRALQSI